MTPPSVLIAALVAALGAAPVLAQVIPTGTPAADILLAQAISEQRVFVTCSALDGQAHPLILANWQRDVAAAAATLTANAVPPMAIAAFTKAASPDNLLPAPDTPFADVRQLCDTYPDWQTRYGQTDFILLATTLPRAFE